MHPPLGRVVHPDRFSLTRIRQRLGIAVFTRFFEKAVDLCQEAGQVWGREPYFDATKVRAHAAGDSLVPRFAVDARGHVAHQRSVSSVSSTDSSRPAPSSRAASGPPSRRMERALLWRHNDGSFTPEASMERPVTLCVPTQ